MLQAVGQERGYVVNSKMLNREINHIDFCYFAEAGNPNWNPPSVVIEHENAWNVEETKKDFWKCCLYAAPLRVTIGYMATEERALDAGRALTEFFDAWQLPKIGETLLIYGWPQEDQNTRRWRYWLLGERDHAWKVSVAQQAAEPEHGRRMQRYASNGRSHYDSHQGFNGGTMLTGRDVHNFVLTARRLKLATPSQGKPFECEADKTTLYLKNSAGNLRKIGRVELDEFCKEFSRTGSRSASYYQTQTFNASYLLALVDAFLKSKDSAGSDQSGEP